MREWLSGRAPPCQGGGRGFDPRLALTSKKLETFRNKGFELFCFIRNCVPILHKAKKTL